jgi:hypothetical protein
MILNIEDGKYHNSFLQEAKKQLTEIIKVKYSAYIKPSMLFMFMCELKEDEEGLPFYSFVDLLVTKASFGLNNKMQVFWKSEDGTKVYPTDDITEKKLIFWIEGLVSEEDFRGKIERNEYLWKRPKEENLINKKEYRFKIREMGWFAVSFPDISIRIKSNTNLDSLNEVVGNAIEEYNKTSNDDRENGLIHYFQSKKIKKGVYLFSIDTGSALVEGVEAVLKALNKSDFNIELLTLE